MNSCVIDGRMVADPVLRKTVSGTSVMTFTVAHNFKDRTTFLTCEAWGTGAEVIADRFRKGDPINLSGYLRQDDWEDKDGNKRSKIILRVEQHGRPLGAPYGEARPERRKDTAESDQDEAVAAIADRHEDQDIPF